MSYTDLYIILTFVWSDYRAFRLECIGTIYDARWIRAATYILKLLIIGRDYYGMEISKAHEMIDVALFIIYVYSHY